MLVRRTSSVYKYQVKSAVGENATADDVLNYIFGESVMGYEEKHQYDFIIKAFNRDKQRRWWHRLNMFWAIPLTIICSPYQYVVDGYVGWTDKTALGRFILRVTGHLEV